jgi:hypothetical protein
MCVFGAFFLNQVGFAGLKVGRIHKLEMSHFVCISDAYYTNLIQLVQFFYGISLGLYVQVCENVG